MTPPKPLTALELAVSARVKGLQSQLIEALAELRRPLIFEAVEGGLIPTCPYCGNQDLTYDEDETAFWTLGPVDGQTITVRSDDGSHDMESGRDGRFHCRSCHADSRLPDNYDLDWLS